MKTFDKKINFFQDWAVKTWELKFQQTWRTQCAQLKNLATPRAKT